MSHGYALWKENSGDLGWGELFLASDGTATVTTEAGSAEVTLDLPDSPFVDVYATPDWVCLLGGADRQVAMGRAAGPGIEVVGEVERVEVGGGFEFESPSARFYDRPGTDQCVLAWEYGVALLDPRDGMVWAHTHRDRNQRLMKITDETVELWSVRRSISVSLVDGSAAAEASASHRDVADHALDDWMREIGA